MTRSFEARFWQAVGVVVGVSGGLLLAYTFGRYGFASLEPRALEYGMAASFAMLAGAAAFLAGRALHVEEAALTGSESVLWRLLAYVCLIGGSFLVLNAKLQSKDLLLDRITMGLAGAFAMMLGVICLVGQRVMAHMHGVLVAQKPEDAAGKAQVAES